MMEQKLGQYNEVVVEADTATRGRHRRSQSENLFRFPEFEEDITADFEFDIADTHQLKLNEQSPVTHISYFRSLSVDADFFAGLDLFQHPHTNSIIDASSTNKPMPPDKLAHLALVDPKRAKRILANRQSASRSKERKIRYTGELEKKVQTLQGEATTLSAQVTKLQRDTSGLTTQNKELQLRLQAMEQAAHLRDALNDALKEELKHLKIIVGEVQIDKGNNAQQHPQYSSQRLTFNSFNTAQIQYAEQQHQLHRPRPTSANTDSHLQLQPNFPGFNQRA